MENGFMRRVFGRRHIWVKTNSGAPHFQYVCISANVGGFLFWSIRFHLYTQRGIHEQRISGPGQRLSDSEMIWFHSLLLIFSAVQHQICWANIAWGDPAALFHLFFILYPFVHLTRAAINRVIKKTGRTQFKNKWKWWINNQPNLRDTNNNHQIRFKLVTAILYTGIHQRDLFSERKTYDLFVALASG